MQKHIGPAGIVLNEAEAPIGIPHFQESGSHPISPSPSAPAALVVNRRPVEHLSARKTSRSPEVHCNGPAQVESRGRSLAASPPFPVVLAVSLLSFLRLQPADQ